MKPCETVIGGCGACCALAGRAHGHLEQNHLPVLRRVALVGVAGERGGAVEDGRTVLAWKSPRGVPEASVPLLAGAVGEGLAADGTYVDLLRAEIERGLGLKLVLMLLMMLRLRVRL